MPVAPAARPLVSAGLRRALPVVVAGAVVVVAGLGAAVVHRRSPLGPDGPVDRWLVERRPSLNSAALWVLNLDHPARLAAVVVVFVVACALARSGRAVVAVLSALVADELLVLLIKDLVARRQDQLPGFTFPSGHTATAAVFATVAVLVAGRFPPPVRRVVRVVAVVLVVLVAAALVIVQAHYLTDTVAGAALGTAVALSVCTAVDVLAERRPSRRWG